jgi:hypothetical protein
MNSGSQKITFAEMRAAGASTSSGVNGPFLDEGGTPHEYRAALARAIKLGWLWLHESGTPCPRRSSFCSSHEHVTFNHGVEGSSPSALTIDMYN